ncbi:hypothetical protein KUCAC02_028573, partial [Chaenocephalus aceratus]
ITCLFSLPGQSPPTLCCFSHFNRGRVSSNSHYPSNLHSTGKNSKQQLENKKE